MQHVDVPITYFGPVKQGLVDQYVSVGWKFYIDGLSLGAAYLVTDDVDEIMEKHANKAYRRITGRFKFFWRSWLGKKLLLL